MKVKTILLNELLCNFSGKNVSGKQIRILSCRALTSAIAIMSNCGFLALFFKNNQALHIFRFLDALLFSCKIFIFLMVFFF